MFVTAIERASAFTRPIYSISRTWGSTDVIPGAATLFFVNREGWALTCAHVAKQFQIGSQLLARFKAYKAERASLGSTTKSRKDLRKLEKKHSLRKGMTVELHLSFVNCVEGNLNVEIKIHSQYDMALLKFSGFRKLGCNTFPIFALDGQNLKQGKVLCRLGFPFPEFTNFEYDTASDEIKWTATGKNRTPQFPIEGMVTRRLLAGGDQLFGFEMSTPGLRGQSGGPAFDTDGRVWGMQSVTAHLDLNFDVDAEVLRDGQKRRVRDSAFLHVGHCIHVDILKEFMRESGVAFREG